VNLIIKQKSDQLVTFLQTVKSVIGIAPGDSKEKLRRCEGAGNSRVNRASLSYIGSCS